MSLRETLSGAEFCTKNRCTQNRRASLQARREREVAAIVQRCGCVLYTSRRGLQILFHIAMGDDAPGPGRGRGRQRKYATAEAARAAGNCARPIRHREEVTMVEAAGPREQHKIPTESSTVASTEVATRFSSSHSSELLSIPVMFRSATLSDWKYLSTPVTTG